MKRLFAYAIAVLVAMCLIEIGLGYIFFLKQSPYPSGTHKALDRVLLRLGYPQTTMSVTDRKTGKPAKLLRRDPILGYGYLPGDYAVTVRSSSSRASYEFDMTIDGEGHRITSLRPNRAGPKIWVLGDSVSNGWVNNDATTFPFVLQSLRPDNSVIDMSVIGYGPVQAYLLAQRALTQGQAPGTVFIAFADYFPERMLVTAAYLKRIRKAPAVSNEFYSGLTLPAAREIGQDGLPKITQVSIKCLESQTCDEGADISSGRQFEILGSLYTGIKARFPKADVAVLYTSGQASAQTQAFFEMLHRHGLVVCDARPRSIVERDTFVPLEEHPGPKAQVYFAKIAREFLETGRCPSP